MLSEAWDVMDQVKKAGAGADARVRLQMIRDRFSLPHPG
ncbi:hypothetical protein ALP32_200394 [Pseudomonas avellanae]|uniref:Uncharacterized protein n=1 Tax=Pseudomonas avellanae TaxID=46257 RepID=A0A3M5U629_9PSED|nr:hypothetical protein ALP32_200394 [Pseudomonas avellanae]